MSDSCEIEITGLNVTIQPKKRVENGVCNYFTVHLDVNLFALWTA